MSVDFLIIYQLFILDGEVDDISFKFDIIVRRVTLPLLFFYKEKNEEALLISIFKKPYNRTDNINTQ